MQPDAYINLVNQAMLLVLILSAPPILVATFVGVGIALLQALTQIQDQTLPYAIKLTATIIVLIFAMGFVYDDVLNFTITLFREFPRMVK